VVYVLPIVEPSAGGPPKKSSGPDMHAGESETAKMLIARPDLVHMDRATQESGADQARLKLPADVYTAIWWYARFPDHYSGDGSAATKERGEFEMKDWANAIVETIRAVKADQTSLRLQNEFFEKAKHPLETRP
jgi:creatinine amidohydrolase